MNNYPYRNLNRIIRESMTSKFLTDGYATSLSHDVLVKGDTSYMYYMEPKSYSTGFVLIVNLAAKNGAASQLHLGDFEARRRLNSVDSNRTKIPLEKGTVVVKGYINGQTGASILTNVEVIFHPSQMPKSFTQVKLNDRERKILFCFSLKEGVARKEALFRLDVSKPEIEDLHVKGLLKKFDNGRYAISPMGDFNRLPNTNSRNDKTLDQW